MLNIFDAINKKNIDEINNILKKDSKSFFKKNTVLKSKNKQDNCPLYCAIEKGDLEVVDTIVKYSRDPHYLNLSGLIGRLFKKASKASWAASIPIA